jgi:hypothetical protein
MSLTGPSNLISLPLCKRCGTRVSASTCICKNRGRVYRIQKKASVTRLQKCRICGTMNKDRCCFVCINFRQLRRDNEERFLLLLLYVFPRQTKRVEKMRRRYFQKFLNVKTYKEMKQFLCMVMLPLMHEIWEAKACTALSFLMEQFELQSQRFRSTLAEDYLSS